VVVGFGGDVSDMQYLDRLLLALSIRENYSTYSSDPSEKDADTADLSAKNLHTYLSKVMYKRRTDFNPLWNQLLVCGFDGVAKGTDKAQGKPFLASVDLLGTTFSSPSLATGFGAHLAQPILRKVAPDEEAVANIDKETAVQAIKDCMKVLFYRDARSMDRYSIAVISRDGVELKEDEALEKQSWAFAETIKGYGTQVV
jgi:20S proteasome subunit beta 7